MTDETNKPGDIGEEEFQFSDVQETGDVFGPQSANKSKFDFGTKINRRNLLIAAGVVIVLLAVYKIVEVVFSSKPTQPAPTVVTPPPITTPSVSIPPPQQPTMDNALKNQLDQVQQHTQQSRQEIQNFREAMNALDEKFSTVQQEISILNQQIEQLKILIEQQSMEIKALKPKPKPAPKVVLGPPKPSLYIQALIPNRAWLVDAQGRTYNVTIGDSVPGMGRVQRILVQQGQVLMSSGAIIKYKNN